MKQYLAKDCLSNELICVHDEDRPNFKFNNFAVFKDTRKKKFIGLVSKSDIINPHRIFADLLTNAEDNFVYSDTPALLCKEKMQLLQVDALPVVDERKKFCGIVTHETIIRHIADAVQFADIPTSVADVTKTGLFNALGIVLHGVERYHDTYTLSHENNVSTMMEFLASELGYDEQYCKDLKQAGSLHDIGKLALPSQLLDKSGKFSAFERQVVEMHSLMGQKILEQVNHPLAQLAANISLYHHEAYDGSGYPHRLKKNKIPVEARICCICDVYEALRAHRPYRENGISHDAIVQKMLNKKNNGLYYKFDPEILAVFAEKHEEFDKIFCATLTSFL